MFTLTSKVNDWINTKPKDFVCKKGLDWFNSLGDATFQTVIPLIQSDKNAESGWLLWSYEQGKTDFDFDIKNLLVDTICKEPRLAAILYQKEEFLEQEQIDGLENSFMNKYPQMRKEIAEKKLMKPKAIRKNTDRRQQQLPFDGPEKRIGERRTTNPTQPKGL